MGAAGLVEQDSQSKKAALAIIQTTFHGGETERGRIEFYEYSRSSYALARLISSTEALRVTGKLPGRIVGAANVELYAEIPEIGSWTYITNLFEAARDNVKFDINFPALFSWVIGKSLDNMDLYNSNSEAIVENTSEVKLDLALTPLTRGRRRKRLEVDQASENSLGPKKLSKSSLQRTRESQKAEKLSRVSLETDISVAREARRILDGDAQQSLENAKRAVEEVEILASNDDVSTFSEEDRIIDALSQYAEQTPKSNSEAAQRAARIIYLTNDLKPRLTRRSLGDRFSAEELGGDPDELDKLAAKSRPLMKEIVLPLRRSPEDMDLSLGRSKRKIVHIDKVRGRMISDSVLSRDVYEMDVFVIEFNRVTFTGKCRIENINLEVPFRLRRELLRRLTIKAIDSLKENNCVFLARPYLDDDGAIRSLLVEDIH